MFVAASCAEDDGGVIVSVDGSDISVEDVRDLLVQAVPEEVDVDAMPLDSPDVMAAINILVGVEAVEDEAAEFGVEAPQFGDPDVDFAETYNQFLEGIATNLVPDLSDADRQAEIDAFMEAATLSPPVCASHLLVETEAEAVDALARIEGGEAFAEVAGEVSIDTVSGAQGGSLGCADPSGYVPEFSNALVALEEGQISDPVQSEFGFHVILREDSADAIAERQASLLSQAEASLDNYLFSQRQAALQAWIGEILEESDVEVDPAFGTWMDQTVRPPA